MSAEWVSRLKPAPRCTRASARKAAWAWQANVIQIAGRVDIKRALRKTRVRLHHLPVVRAQKCQSRDTRRVTDSRNLKDTGGHTTTRRRAKFSTGGHSRTRRDTGGYEVRRVRDRDAPGSNPGPPTKIKFKIADSARPHFLLVA
jgi:hypothetical protein